jgi:hypothetical protein
MRWSPLCRPIARHCMPCRRNYTSTQATDKMNRAVELQLSDSESSESEFESSAGESETSESEDDDSANGQDLEDTRGVPHWLRKKLLQTVEKKKGWEKAVLKRICDKNPTAYGARGSTARKKVQNLAQQYKKMDAVEYYSLLKELGVKSYSELRRERREKAKRKKGKQRRRSRSSPPHSKPSSARRSSTSKVSPTPVSHRDLLTVGTPLVHSSQQSAPVSWHSPLKAMAMAAREPEPWAFVSQFRTPVASDSTMDDEVKNRVRRKYNSLCIALFCQDRSLTNADAVLQYDEVITLTMADLRKPVHIISCIFIGKVSSAVCAADNNVYDGYSIKLSVLDEEWDSYLPAAWLMEDPLAGGNYVVLKVAAMPWLWTFGTVVTFRSGTENDSKQDRASLVTDGTVPSRYICVRFPPEIPLKNIFVPASPGERKIKPTLSVIKDPSPNSTRTIQDAIFYIAVHDDNARRSELPQGENPADQLASVYSRLGISR